jgi:hypothetical protein
MLKQLGNRTGEAEAAFVAVASRPRSSRYWCQRNGAVPRARIARNYAESVGALVPMVPMVPGTRRSALIAIFASNATLFPLEHSAGPARR